MDFAYVKQEKQNNQTCTCDQIGIDNYFKMFFCFGKFPHIIKDCKYIFT